MSRQEMFYATVGYDIISLVAVQSFSSVALQYFILLVQAVLQLLVYRKIEEPEYDYEAGYAKRAATMAIIILFGCFIPILFVFGLAYLIIVHFTDQFLVVHFFKKSQNTGAFCFFVLTTWYRYCSY